MSASDGTPTKEASRCFNAAVASGPWLSIGSNDDVFLMIPAARALPVPCTFASASNETEAGAATGTSRDDDDEEEEAA